MKITNNCARIIGIGQRYLMPDESCSVSEETANLPSVQAMKKMGFITIEKENVEKKPQQADVAPEATEIPESVAEEKLAQKAARRKKSAE